MILVQNCRMMDPASQTDGLRDILIDEDRITKIAEAGTIDPAQITKEKEDELRILNADGLIAAPGLVDTHVHFRDPGAEYKEDILTGAVSAAAGGVTSVVLMANTNPHVDQEETLSYVLEKGAKTGIHVYTCANVTMDMEGDELTDMEALAKAGAVGFTDDGKPLLDAKIARKAMQEAARVHKPISFHEENPAYIQNNGVNAGKASEYFGIGGSDRQDRHGAPGSVHCAGNGCGDRDSAHQRGGGGRTCPPGEEKEHENPRRGDTPSFHADGGRRDGTRYDGEDEPAASHGS